MRTFHAGFHRGQPGARTTGPRALYEDTLQGDSPWDAAKAFAESIPDSEKAQGQIILVDALSKAIYLYGCLTSYVPAHMVPEQVTRELVA